MARPAEVPPVAAPATLAIAVRLHEKALFCSVS
jgi:hypothetical protein